MPRQNGVGIIAAGLLVLAACSTPTDEVRDPSPAGQVQSSMAAIDWTDSEGSYISPLVEAMTRFGTEAFGEVVDPGSNLVFSPASIAMAFGMARAGAEGETAAEIDAVLGFSSDSSPTLEAFQELGRVLAKAAPAKLGALDPSATRPARAFSETEPPALEIANGAFSHTDASINEEYLQTLDTHYGAEVIPVDFSNPSEATQVIDDWVSEQTQGRIDRLFDSLDPENKLVLANAVYLKAE